MRRLGLMVAASAVLAGVAWDGQSWVYDTSQHVAPAMVSEASMAAIGLDAWIGNAIGSPDVAVDSRFRDNQASQDCGLNTRRFFCTHIFVR